MKRCVLERQLGWVLAGRGLPRSAESGLGKVGQLWFECLGCDGIWQRMLRWVLARQLRKGRLGHGMECLERFW